MKKQLLAGFIVIITMLLFWPMKVGAEGQEIELDTSSMDFSDVDAILEQSGTNEMLQSQTQAQTVSELLQMVLSGNIKVSGKQWGEAFGNLLWGNLQTYMGLMLQIIGLVLVSQFFNSLTLQVGEGSVGEVGFLCVYGILVLILLESFHVVYLESKETIENVRNLSLYMMPAMAAVAVAGGFPVSSILQGEALTGGFSLILTLMKNVFATGVLWITTLEMINFIGKKPVLNQLTSLGRTLVEKGVKTISVVYLLAMGILGAVTPSADRMIYKISNTLLASVPVVGTAMSGAMDSVMAGSIFVKNGIGAVGCIVLLCICLIPIGKLVAFWLIYRLMAVFLAPIADERIIRLIAALSRSTAILLGILVSSMIIFTGVVGILIVTLRQ